MKNLSFIVLGIIAAVLIGLAVWQLMWMSDVVDNYGPATSYKRPDPKAVNQENTFKDKGAHAIVTDHPAVQEPRVVRDQASYAENKEVTGTPVKESPKILHTQDRTIKGADRKNVEPSGQEKITIREDENTISIKLKSGKPLPPQRQMITRPSVSQRKPIDIPVPSVRQHATSTSPY